MNSAAEKIKAHLDIADFIQGYLKLQRAGTNFKANCPFHNEKTPSFFISPERQIWHCFGCQKGGDVISFVQEIEGMDFIQALRMLADKTGIQLENVTFESETRDQKEQLKKINELAAAFFEKQLRHSSGGGEAIRYLNNRGVNQESIKNFRVGYAPNTWNALSDFLCKAGYSEIDLISSGLALKSQNNLPPYDRFRGRIIFPIYDIIGNVIGFAGRILESQHFLQKKNPADLSSIQAKYVNTPQTLLYDKSRAVYGLDRAKTAIRQNDNVIVVEGNLDVIMSHQVGVENVIASSGTALTDGHLSILKRYTSSITFCFDDDSAGQSAAKRAIALALVNGYNVRALAMESSDGIKDTADYVAKYGTKWKDYVETHTVGFINFLITSILKNRDLSRIEEKRKSALEVLVFVKNIRNKIEQSYWLSELSTRLQIKENVLADEMSGLANAGSAVASYKNTGEKPKNMVYGPEEALLSFFLLKPSFLETTSDYGDLFTNSEYRAILERFLLNKKASKDLADGLDRGLKLRLEILALRAQEMFEGVEEVEYEEHFNNLKRQIQVEKLRSELQTMELVLKKMERESPEKVTDLMNQIREISFKLKNIN